MILGALALLSLGRADPGIPTVDLQRWSFPVDSRGTFWTIDASDAPKGWYNLGLAAGYQHDPVVYVRDADGATSTVIAQALSTAVQGAISLGRLRLGGEIPVLEGVRGESLDTPAALGDVAMDLKGVVLDHTKPVGLALNAHLRLPTTSSTAPWAGDEVVWAVDLVGDLDLGPALIALNLGTRGEPSVILENVRLGDVFAARLGAAWTVIEPLTLGLDLVADLPYSAPLSNPAAAPVELLGGASLRLGSGWTLRLGGGAGLTRGLGSPDARVVSWLGYSPQRSWDADADGILDARDACPRQPEDLDAWQDEDGCPDPLTHLRVVLQDDQGQALGEAGLVGAALTQGEGGVWEGDLPPGDLRLAASAAGHRPATLTVHLSDGPPQTQTLTLQRLLLGELVVRALDPEGAPLTRAAWTCAAGPLPDMRAGVGTAELPAGLVQLRVSAPGYIAATFPEEIEAGQRAETSVTLRPAKVAVTREKLVIADRIYFDTNRATIKPESFPLLDEIAGVLLDRTDILELRIEGHTDSRGSNAVNLTLSEQRAASVRDYLVGKGVVSDRLSSVGYGEAKPVDDRENPEAWERNRRVEFFIEAWAP